MEQNFNRRVATDLDLNGPLLAISSHPSDVTASNGDTKTFSVSASATFPGNADPSNSGTLTFQWFLDDGTDDIELKNESIGVTYSGVTTDTLTLTGIQSPSQNGDKYFCRINYIAADKYDESEKGTGIPITGSINSNKATLTVNPFIQILSQPSSVDREFNVNGELTVTAQLSDSSYPDDIGYQWYRNDNAISDGRQTSTRIERGTVIDVIVETEDKEVVTVKRHNYTFNKTYTHSSGSQSHTIESTASNIRIEIAGAGGGKGGTDAGGNGGLGGSGIYGKFDLSRTGSGGFPGSTLTFHAGAKGSDGRDANNAPGGQGGGFPNYGSGGRGGNSGGRGTSGSGGGGGGTSAVIQEAVGEIIVAGGGGGGGGASHVRLHGGNGGNAGSWDSKGSTMYSDGGHGGHPCERADGGGGGGGGAGYVSSPGTGAGAGGAGGGDGYRGGLGGEGGESAYRSDYVDQFVGNVGYNGGQGYVNLSYNYYVDVYDTRIDTITTQREVEREIVNSIDQHIDFSGTKGKTLTVKADYNTVENLKCIVSSPTATNSPVTSDTVQFSSHSDLIDKTLYMEEAFWHFDQWRGGYATGAMDVSLSNANLTNGEVTLGYDDGTAYVAAGTGRKGINIFTSFYVASDTEVEIDLYGGTGVAWTPLVQNSGLNASSLPGGGGYGRIRFTMKARREYTIAGMFGTINTPYLYELDELIAVVGQGGGNNTYGAGGGGGGFGRNGQGGGGGTGHGNGGPPPSAGTGGANYSQIQQIGILGSAYYDAANISSSDMISKIESNGDEYIRSNRREGGRVKRYSRSVNNSRNVSTRQMWVRQENGASSGLPEHTLMGSSNGKTDTATIERGFWDIDYAFLGTAGGRGIPRGALADDPTNNNGVNTTCVGGNGAFGGSGGYNGSGGGGGSGYLNETKDIIIVDTYNGFMGEPKTDSKIVIRLAT